MGWKSLQAGREQGQGHSVAGAECHSPVCILYGMELGSNGESQVLCELRERQGPEERGIWHKERCCPHFHRLKAATVWNLKCLPHLCLHVNLHSFQSTDLSDAV